MSRLRYRGYLHTISRAVLALGLLALVWPKPALAVDDLVTPRALGMGGAMRANATGALGPLINPSGMAMVHQYAIEAFYGFDVQSIGNTVHVSLADSITSRLAAGIYYTYVHSAPELRYTVDGPPGRALRQGSETGLALALPIGEHFALGLTNKYVSVSTEVGNPSCDPLVPDSCRAITIDSTTSHAAAAGYTLDFGMTLRLGDSVSFGIAGQNLVPLHSVEAPMTLGMGLSYNMGQSFLIEVDGAVYFDRFHKPSSIGPNGERITGAVITTGMVAGGLEYLIAGKVPIRAGVSYDTGLTATYLSLGTGYTGTKFAIDLSYRQKVQAGIDSLLALAIRVFLQ